MLTAELFRITTGGILAFWPYVVPVWFEVRLPPLHLGEHVHGDGFTFHAP
jgi:hypothetical protein